MQKKECNKTHLSERCICLRPIYVKLKRVYIQTSAIKFEILNKYRRQQLENFVYFIRSVEVIFSSSLPPPPPPHSQQKIEERLNVIQRSVYFILAVIESISGKI